MRYITAAVVGAVMSAGAAQAAVVDLTYTIEAEVASYRFTNDYYPEILYPGPEIGDTETFALSLVLDTEKSSSSLNNGTLLYDDFDPATGAISYYDLTSADTFEAFNLLPDGTGTGQEYRAFEEADFSPLVWADIRYDVTSWSVEGLPEIAPVPLPASLPLLAVGFSVMGLAARRRSKRAGVD